MINQQTNQQTAIAKLERKGWTFSSWISDHTDDNNQIAVMIKRPNHYTTQMCEVWPDGSIAD